MEIEDGGLPLPNLMGYSPAQENDLALT